MKKTENHSKEFAMRVGTVCSGIGAPELAWKDLGWKFAWNSEIDPFPCAVLKHRFPDVPNLGDMTKIFENETFKNEPIDILCGGTPCQGFSIAGLRAGLDDPRSQLSLTFGRIAAEKRPRWLLWENVPGVLSSNRGRDFAEFLGLLSGQGIDNPKGGWKKSGIISGYRNAYGLAWRVLDAQYFGVAQRRERVFVVGHLGDWRRAAAVLFEPEGCAWHPAPRRKTVQESSAFAASSIGAYIETEVGGTVRAAGGDLGGGGETLVKWPAEVSCTINASFGAKLGLENQHIDQGAPMFVPLAFGAQNSSSQGDSVGDVSPTLDKSKVPGVAYFDGVQITSKTNQSSVKYGNVGGTLSKGSQPSVVIGMDSEFNASEVVLDGIHVRRLTPRECERLQGFKDDWTNIPYGRGVKPEKLESDWIKYQARGNPKGLTREECAKLAADGPRYKSIGNSMPVPLIRWLGERIEMVNKL